MILSRRAALGGVELDEVHERIVIRGIDAGVPHENISAVNRMGGAGQRITTQHWETMEVSIRYAINVQKEQLQLRREIFEAVNDWALQKGWLTINYMPGRRLWVDHVVFPSAGDLWEWTDEFTLTLRAYGLPFWQDTDPTAVSVSNVQSERLYIGVRGQAQSVLDVAFKNTSNSTINNFSVNASGHTIVLQNIALASGETLVIDHTEDGLLRMKAANRNVFGNRTAASADDLYVDPGRRWVDISTQQPGKATLSCYGRYC